MAEKALLFKDSEIEAAILVSKTAVEAKKLGRKVRNFNQDLSGWDVNNVTAHNLFSSNTSGLQDHCGKFKKPAT